MTEQEFQTAMDELGDSVFRLAYSWLKNRADAEDVMQETLLKLYTQDPFDTPEHERFWVVLKLYLEPKPFESREHRQRWVFRVASNECRKLLRTPWKRRTGPLEDADEAAVFDQPAQSELFQEVMSLPPNYRAAVYLHYYEGYSVKEIAVLMHALPSTVQTWLFRARGQLKLKLKEADSP